MCEYLRCVAVCCTRDFASREYSPWRKSRPDDEIAQRPKQFRVKMHELVHDVMRKVRNRQIMMPRLPLPHRTQ